MHRVARHHARIVTAAGAAGAAGKASAVRGWSVLSRPCAQRAMTNGPSGGGGKGGSPDNTDDGTDTQQVMGGAARAGADNQQPAGRGRGAFSQYLRTHERKISKQMRKIDNWSEGDRGGDAVDGQFEDSEQGSDTKSSGIPRDADKSMFEQKSPYEDESRSSSKEDNWQEQWFSHEDKRLDKMDLGMSVEEENELGGDLPELDDCEEDDHFDPESEWDDDVWKRYTPEDIEEFKILGARLEQEEAEQMENLRKKWKQMKAESKKQHGTADHLELPDIIISHEISYEAPPGKASEDRPVPLPRALDTILDSMQLPPGLDVKPDDPEYEQVVNMWMSVSRNNTMDETMKKNVIGNICTFIAKRRNSDAFQKALETQDFSEERGKRTR